MATAPAESGQDDRGLDLGRADRGRDLAVEEFLSASDVSTSPPLPGPAIPPAGILG